MKFKVTVVLDGKDDPAEDLDPKLFAHDVRHVLISELTAYGFTIVGDVLVERVDD